MWMTTLRNAAWPRWLGSAIAIVTMAAVAGELAGWPFLRSAVQRAVSAKAEAPVVLDGRFHARFLYKPQIEVERLYVRAAHALGAAHLLELEGLRVTWGWRDVGHLIGMQRLRVHTVEIRTLEMFLLRAPDGRSTWQFPGASPVEQLPSVASLQVGDGRIVVNDEPLQTQLAIVLQGSEGEGPSAGLPAGYNATVQGRYQAAPLDLKLYAGGALPLLHEDTASARAADVPVRLEGRAGAARFAFDGTTAALWGDRRLQGSLRFAGPSLARVGAPLGLTLPQSPPFELHGELGHAASVWRLQVDRAVMGRSVLNGEFQVDTRQTPPRLQGRLGGARLALADLGPAVGVGTGGTGGRVLPQVQFDLPSLQQMSADVQVAIDELEFGTERLAPLHTLRTHVTLEGGLLRLDALRATVGGGEFSGMTQLDANPDPARWDVDLRFRTVDVAEWVSGLRVAPGRAAAPAQSNAAALRKERLQARQAGHPPVRAYLTGTVSGAVKASGRGRSTAQILSSLDGRAQIMLREGTLSHLATEAIGLDVAEALGVLVRGDRPLPLRCAWFDLVIANGVVQPRLALLDNADTHIAVTGSVDLRNESLAVRMTARPKDFSPFTLRSPIRVGGTLADPQVSVESGQVAGKALGALALGVVVAPIVALLPFVDLGVGDQGDPCARTPGRLPARAATAPAAPASAALR
jgi:uncharacterized protein involved in outer membrane biogenesis